MLIENKKEQSYLKCVLILLVLSKDILAQNCVLDAAQFIAHRSWIYAVKPTPTTWDVLHTNYIADQQTLYMICNSAIPTIELRCNQGVLQQMPSSAKCTKRIKATVASINNEDSCRQKGGEMYEARYALTNGFNIPLYKACYSQSKAQAIYSRHSFYGLIADSISHKRPTFRGEAPVIHCDLPESFKTTNVYNTFVGLLGSTTKYVTSNKDIFIDRGHLANCQDFPTWDQMDATCLYINIIPQFSSVNRGTWSSLENWVHNLPAPARYVEVITGAFDVLSLEHSQTKAEVPMYLMPNNMNPIPKWMYKVVKYDNKCYAFVLFNRHNSDKRANISPPCRRIDCPVGLKFNTAFSGDINCCDYGLFKTQIGQHAALC